MKSSHGGTNGKRKSFLSPEANDFAPGLLAIQESPPARLPRAVLYAVFSLFFILLLWAIIGKLDIIASADGRLIPQTYIKVVQPADAGIIKEILVHEGELVHEGQVLMRMDPQDTEADITSLGAQLAYKSLQLRRIDAELSGTQLLRNKNDPSDLFHQVSAQYSARRQTYNDEMARANAALKKSQHDYDAGAQVLNKLRQTNPILKSQAEAYANLGQDGYAPKVTVGDKQRAYLENEQDLHAQEATVEGLSQAVEEASGQVQQIHSKYRSDLEDERITADTDAHKIQQDWTKQTHKASLLELRAPQAGIVKDLSTHTIGTVVSSGTVLLSLVPENEQMVAEVMIKNDDVGFVHSHQKVKVKLASYPFQKYGMIDGEVQQIWPDATDDNGNSKESKSSESQANSKESEFLSYKALVSLDRQNIRAGSETLSLVPGMHVIVEINQGRRTVMEYLLSPISKTLSESGRER